MALEEVEVNWFQRHLNWTLVLGIVAGYAVMFALSLLLFIVSETEDVYNTLVIVIFMLYVLSIVILSGWVLRKKSHSLWYLLLFLIPLWAIIEIRRSPFPEILSLIGPFVILLLPNKSEHGQRLMKEASNGN